MHVAVTGASSGIGEAIAREFARAGAKLTVVARRKSALDALAAEIGAERCLVCAQDLSDPARACDWIAEAERTHGPIDVLVNNAGMENSGPFRFSDPAEGQRLLQLNFVSPLLIKRRVVEGMLARRSGTIVDVASVAGLAPTPLQVWYGASKAGLAAASEALRAELRTTGVHVVTVYPGPVKTAMSDAAFEVFGGRKGLAGAIPEGTTEVLARKVRVAVERRKPRIVYPGFYRGAYFMPWLSRWISGRFIKVPEVPVERTGGKP